ncbi:hypothetical protein [Dactylosporangium sp. CA-092794]|uniref:hypothetical protein n=1 Tax=Dactylosporangium sp. CA-092794 TaxID=3239929 RepID=UPI003D8DB2E4
MLDSPAAELKVPVPAEQTLDEYLDVFGYFSYLSPSHWITALLEQAIGIDPIAWCAQLLQGDWTAFEQCGLAYANLGRACHRLGLIVEQELLKLDAEWDGNAADAAYVYFSDLATKVAALRGPLEQAAKDYHDAGRGVWLVGSQVQNLLEAIIDEAIIAAAAAAIGSALVETGVGTIAGYGVAAIQIARIIEKFAQVSQKIQYGGTLMQGFIGEGMAIGYQGGGDLGRYPLPGNAYDHPGVA